MDLKSEGPKCLHDTPLKTALSGSPTQYHDHEWMHSSMPIVSNSNIGSGRMNREDTSVVVAESLNKTEQRLRTMSFKRQRLEVRLRHLQRKTLALRVRDEVIKRRNENLNAQRMRIEACPSRSSIHGSTCDVTQDSKRLFTSPKNAPMANSHSQQHLGNFRRNSVMPRASHKVIPPPSTVIMEGSCLQQTIINQDIARFSCQQTDASTIPYKRMPEIKKTPSIRLKRFLQKKLKLLP